VSAHSSLLPLELCRPSHEPAGYRCGAGITYAGLKTVEELQEVVAEAADEVAADLTGEQVEQLSALHDRIIGRSRSRLRPVASVPEPDDP